MQFVSRLRYIALAFLLGLPATTSAQGPKKVLAGWYDIIPQVGYFTGTYYQPPEVAKNKDKELVYSQTVRYDAPTSAIRSFDFTLLRDPAIKKSYAPDVLQAMPDHPTETKIGKYRAWKWQEGKEGRQRKLVVVLADDRAVIITSVPGSFAFFPMDQADKVDWEKIANALKNPPRTDFTSTVETFRVLTKGSSVAKMYDWCGSPKTFTKEENAPKIYRLTYPLADGSQVVVVSDGGRINAIRHEMKDGKVVDLLK
jgi:hypothetical protein